MIIKRSQLLALDSADIAKLINAVYDELQDDIISVLAELSYSVIIDDELIPPDILEKLMRLWCNGNISLFQSEFHSSSLCRRTINRNLTMYV